jgi:hypothetical protein
MTFEQVAGDVVGRELPLAVQRAGQAVLFSSPKMRRFMRPHGPAALRRIGAPEIARSCRWRRAGTSGATLLVEHGDPRSRSVVFVLRDRQRADSHPHRVGERLPSRYWS